MELLIDDFSHLIEASFIGALESLKLLFERLVDLEQALALFFSRLGKELRGRLEELTGARCGARRLFAFALGLGEEKLGGELFMLLTSVRLDRLREALLPRDEPLAELREPGRLVLDLMG